MLVGMHPLAGNCCGCALHTLSSFKLAPLQAAVTYVKRFESEHAGDAPVDDAGNTHLHLVAESGASYDVGCGYLAGSWVPL